MYSVFTDFHHASLLQSLILLFEKRLGGKVYRPIGMQWAERGYWKVYDHPATQAQFLGIGAATPDGSPRLNDIDQVVMSDEKNPAHYRCHDIDSGTYNKAITWPDFMSTHIDIVIASLPQHVEPFKRLCELHPNHPKLIFQIGNAWTVEAGSAPNVMASAIVPNVPENIHFISYHQEFDTNIFNPWSTGYENFAYAGMWDQTVSSFVNCFDLAEHYMYDWQLFQQVERSMNGWTFKSYGGQCRDGAVGPANKLAYTMKESAFIWHTKVGGDGYGHIIHNAGAVGRPLIVKKDYYQGKLAEPLLKDGETCIAIDGLSADEVIRKIQYYNEPERHTAMCKAAYANFTRICNFDAEFEQLMVFLANLK